MIFFKLLKLPLVYACIVGTVFHRWVDANPVIAYGIFFFLCALPVLCVLKGVYNFIRDFVRAVRG
jgi:hypothetical protein